MTTVDRSISQGTDRPSATNAASTAPQGPLERTGDILELTGRAIRLIPFTVAHYLPEIIRQAGIIVVGSLPVVALICFFSGGTCGLEMTVIGRQFGANTLAPGAVVLCTVREIAPFVFGYILAAKVGCGIVAELGAMRVREEIDAMDVMGIRSVAYLVSARLTAAFLVLPAMYVISQAVASAGSFVVSGLRFADISRGTWLYVYFSFLDTNDFIRILTKGLLMSLFVMSVSLYYGYTTRGGPIEVGVSTARAMAVNIVGVTIINVGLSLIFWGVGAPFPIA